MELAELNNLLEPERKELLQKCCGAQNWVERMNAFFPVQSKEELFAEADRTWFACTEADWREAFEHHPKIGDLSSLKDKFANTGKWAANEQAGVNQTSEEILRALAEGNKKYEEKFGYIFIVCATGKTAEEMLALLQERLPNSPEAEIKIAMAEQNKITRIRLEKLLAA